MRVVVVGATGNAGTSLLRALAEEPQVESVLGLARRRPEMRATKTTFAEADVTRSNLVAHFEGADAVVHLAWLIQPSRDLATLRRTNVDGSARVFQAVRDAGVPALVYASSVGAYSSGPKDRMVDESWPTAGIPTSFYSRQKAEVERRLDRLESDEPGIRVVRLRPALIFKREAASGIRRLFAGPLLPSPLVRPGLIPLVPAVEGLRFQAVHSHDVGEAYRLAVVGKVRGAFNLAAEPVLDPEELGRLLGARPVPVPRSVVRVGTEVSWRLRLHPTPSGWVDMALGVPLMSSERARVELGWRPRYSAGEALLDLIGGIHDRAGVPTPPLASGTGGPLRVRELLGGVGGEAV